MGGREEGKDGGRETGEERGGEGRWEEEDRNERGKRGKRREASPLRGGCTTSSPRG